jgi:luciferase family oxidoreductase group 1
VLDQSPIRAGGTPAQAVAESVELARACERWGYHRYWVAEHHASDGLAGASPEILAARLAAATQTMRVGTGGVMLSHYSALKVAEQFRMLERSERALCRLFRLRLLLRPFHHRPAWARDHGRLSREFPPLGVV